MKTITLPSMPPNRFSWDLLLEIDFDLIKKMYKNGKNTIRGIEIRRKENSRGIQTEISID